MFSKQLFGLVVLAFGLGLSSSLALLDPDQPIDNGSSNLTPKEQIINTIGALSRVAYFNHKRLDSVVQSQEELKTTVSRIEENVNLLTDLKSQSQNESNEILNRLIHIEILNRLDRFEIFNRLDHIESLLKPSNGSTKAPQEPIFTLVTDSKKNWFEAFADCRKRGLALASVQNEAEYQNILSQIIALEDIQKSESFWLSATDLIHQDNSYVWMSSGQSVRYEKWCPEQPNKWPHPDTNEKENCMELRAFCNHGMNDEVCSNQKYYVCENRNYGSPTVSGVPKKKTFTIVTGNKLNWFAALADCQAQGLRLASIDNEQEQEHVINLIKFQVAETYNQTNFWLSGSDMGRSGEYVWMTTGQPLLGYTAWFTGSDTDAVQPDAKEQSGKEEHCLEMRNEYGYSWNNEACSFKNYYICDNQN